MAFPATVLVLTARIAYGADPAADPADWDDLWVSVNVRVAAGVSKSGGRSGETGTADAGTCTFTVADPSGNHTPRNPRSIYWPYVRRMTPVQLLLNPGSGDLEWFEGFISSALPRWDKSGRTPLQTVVITAKGILHRLIKGAAALRPALHRALLASSPLGCWILDDGDSATVAASALPGGAPMVFVGEPLPGQVDSPIGGTGKTPQLVTGTGGTDVDATYTGSYVARDLGTNSTGWAVDFWTEFVGDPDASGGDPAAFPVRWRTTGTLGNKDVRVQIGYDPSVDQDAVSVTCNSATTGASLSNFGYAGGAVGSWHHVRVVHAQNGADVDQEIWLDGVLAVSDTLTAVTLGQLTNLAVGNYQGLGAGTQAIDAISLSVTGLVVYDTATPVLSAANVYQAGLAWAGETVSARMARLCAEEGIAITVAAGTTPTMGPQGTGTLVAELRRGEATDHGVLFEDGFALAYQPRSARYNADYALDLVASDLAEAPEPAEDDQNIRNALTVKREGGSSARYEDEESIAAESRIDRGDVEISSDTDVGLLNHASWLVKLTTVPVMRVETLELDFAARPALIPTWVASGLGGRMRVAEIPDDRLDDLDVFVEGAGEEIGPKHWRATANCSPARPYTVAVVEGGGAPDEPFRLDTGGSQLTRDVTTSGTTLRVCTTGKKLWTTSAAFPNDFPPANTFLVGVDGEQVPVSAIAAMAAATYVGAGTPAHGSNASVAPTLPGSLADGDLLVAIAAIRNSGTGVPDEPAGWDTLKLFGNLGLFTRRYRTGVLAPTVSFTGGVANATTSAAIIAVRDATAVLLTDPATQLNSSAANIATPALAITRDYCLILAAAWKQDDWTGSAPLSGFTEAIDTSSTTGDDQGITLAYRIDTTAAAVAAGSFTITGGASAISRSIVVALRAGQQAFTVTRSGNQVVRAHEAGTAVQLYNPAPPAL